MLLLPHKLKFGLSTRLDEVWTFSSSLFYSAAPLKMMELESTVLKHVDLNLLLPTSDEINSSDSIMSNRHEVRFQSA